MFKTHCFVNCGSGHVYDLTQSDESISDGDLLVIPECGLVGFLYQAWPVAYLPEGEHNHSEAHGEFHCLKGPEFWLQPEHAQYFPVWFAAEALYDEMHSGDE